MEIVFGDVYLKPPSRNQAENIVSDIAGVGGLESGLDHMHKATRSLWHWVVVGGGAQLPSLILLARGSSKFRK